MADIPSAAHAEILTTIRGAQADVVALRRTTQVETGYKGFELVEAILATCLAAISGEREKGPVITMVQTATGALALFGGGAVAPAVERTRKKLSDILQELEPNQH
jgi:hypothetical protein